MDQESKQSMQTVSAGRLKSELPAEEAHFQRASVLQVMGHHQEALSAFRKAVQLGSREPKYWQALLAQIRRVPIHPDDQSIHSDLFESLTNGVIDLHHVRDTASQFLWIRPAIHKLTESPLSAETLAALYDPLLIHLLEGVVNTDPNIEHLLTWVRRQLLQAENDGHLHTILGDNGAVFVAALAQQCFLNEFVFFETTDEIQQINELSERIDKDYDGTNLAEPLLLLATYRPLWQLSISTKIIRYYQPSDEHGLYKVLRMQLFGPLLEKHLREEIPALTPIIHPVSKSVQTHYENYPYPRWLHIDKTKAQRTEIMLRSLFPNSHQLPSSWPDSPQVLVAGCGTGKQAISAARRYQGSQILAIDLSRASLAYGIRKARELDVHNIEFMQGDINELSGINQRFDIIECVGVLHHTQDPWRGLDTLLSVLKAKGVMRLGLYSRLARLSVAAAKDYIRKNNLPSTASGVRDFRRHIFRCPQHHPLKRLLRIADFYSTSECRDAVFHLIEHTYGLEGISEVLKQRNLHFLGFEFANDEPFTQYRRAFPRDIEANNLKNWHIYEKENPDTFTSMYQFWVLKQR